MSFTSVAQSASKADSSKNVFVFMQDLLTNPENIAITKDPEIDSIVRKVSGALASVAKCKVEYGYFVNFNISKKVNGLEIKLFDFEDKDSVEIAELSSNSVLWIFTKLSQNQKTDSIFKTFKLEISQFNRRFTMEVPKKDYEVLIQRMRYCEFFLKTFEELEYQECYHMMADTVKKSMTDTVFVKYCKSLAKELGSFKNKGFHHFLIANDDRLQTDIELLYFEIESDKRKGLLLFSFKANDQSSGIVNFLMEKG